MALDINQTLQDIANRIFTNIQANLPELNPSTRQSVIRALSIAFSGRFYDLYAQQARLKEEIFPTTATQQESIDPWGIFKGITLKGASSAIGFITTNADAAGTLIPNLTDYTANGFVYSTIGGDVFSQELTLNVEEISRVGNVVSITTDISHQLATNIEVTINGVDQSEYNGTFSIHVTSDNSFTYVISGSTLDPSGNNITTTAIVAIANVKADVLGVSTNIDAGGQLTLQTSIAGINNNAYVQYSTLSGGADDETFLEYKARVIDRYQNPIAHFSNQFIINEVLNIPGNTRCWVFDTQPEAGWVSIYFVLDNTDAILPTGQDVQNVSDVLNAVRPADIPAERLLIQPPQAKVIDFTFSTLVPNTLGMQQAIRTNLELFFKTQTNVAQNITQDSYRAAIYQSLNEETGEFVKEFDLTQPAGTIEIGTGELGLLGNVVF